jgi:hypothetical protein
MSPYLSVKKITEGLQVAISCVHFAYVPKPKGRCWSSVTPAAPFPRRLFRLSSHHSIWSCDGLRMTVLWPNGTATVPPQNVQRNGRLYVKVPWWRGPGSHGTLRIHGRRLDKPAPALQADVPPGYGDSGFQASAIPFPTVGCWQVTGRVGKGMLTMVMRVLKIRRWQISLNHGLQHSSCADYLPTTGFGEGSPPLTEESTYHSSSATTTSNPPTIDTFFKK